MSGAEVGAAYDARAEVYVARLGAIDQVAPDDRATVGEWSAAHPGRLLDAGCGPGHWAAELAATRSDPVVALDASAAFLLSARQRYGGLPLLRADLAALPFPDGSFAAVLAWFSLIHADPTDLPHLLGELARVLAPGGSLLVGFFLGEPGHRFDHAVTAAYHWSPAALADLLAPLGLLAGRVAERHAPGERAVAALEAHREPGARLDGGPTLGR